jgi:hypothetical protein
MATYLLDPDSGTIVLFDVTISENHEDVADVTDHPVEEGVNIVDHIRKAPFTLSLEAFVTNTPVTELIFGPIPHNGNINTVELAIPQYEPPIEATPGSLFRLAAAGIRALADAITGGPPPFKAQVLLFGDAFNRVLDVQTVLTELQEKGALLTAVTSTRYYENMMLTRIGTPVTEAGGVSFQVDLRQVRLVTTANVAAPQPVEPRGKASEAKGAQAPKEITGKEAAKALKSLGAQLLDGTISAFK